MEEFSSHCARMSKLQMINTYNLVIHRENIIYNSKNTIFEDKPEHVLISKTILKQFIDQPDQSDIKCDLNDNNLFYRDEKSKLCFEDSNKIFNIDNENDCQIKFKNNCKFDNTNFKNDFPRKHYQHFIAGALAGAVSRTLTAPLERLKILYQVNYRCNRIKPPSIIRGLRELYCSEGIAGLFRGNLINVTKATPDTAIKLYVFEKVKFYLNTIHGDKLSIDKLFLAGAIAGVTASFSVFPLDVIKTRLSAAPSGTYSGILDTINKLYREGRVRIFYKGVEANICSSMPNSGSHASDNAKYLSTPILMLTGGLSAMISSSLLYPLQTIQSRLIMQSLSKSEMHMIRFNAPFFYIGDNLIIKKKQTMIHVIKSTFQKEGVRGFYKGYVAGITKIIIGNAISFASYEKFKTLLKF